MARFDPSSPASKGNVTIADGCSREDQEPFFLPNGQEKDGQSLLPGDEGCPNLIDMKYKVNFRQTPGILM